jgi:hypothetical protein
MVVVISLGSQTSKPFLSKKCINIICCKGRNIFVYGAKEIVYRTAVRSNGRFLQVPLHGFTVDLFENIFVHNKTSLRVVFAVTTTHQEVRWHHNSDCGKRLIMLFFS